MTPDNPLWLYLCVGSLLLGLVVGYYARIVEERRQFRKAAKWVAEGIRRGIDLRLSKMCSPYGYSPDATEHGAADTATEKETNHD